MRLGSIEHKRFLAAAHELAKLTHPIFVCALAKVTWAHTEAILAGDALPGEEMVRNVANLAGLTTRGLLEGTAAPPETIEEAIELGRGQALKRTLTLIKARAESDLALGEKEQAEALEGVLGHLVLYRLGGEFGQGASTPPDDAPPCRGHLHLVKH